MSGPVKPVTLPLAIVIVLPTLYPFPTVASVAVMLIAVVNMSVAATISNNKSAPVIVPNTEKSAVIAEA